MINTVLGKINNEKLGLTLTHEHITWDREGEHSEAQYDEEEVIETILPFLMEIKNCGCDTFVDANTWGSGRDINILKECAKRSGLNILTNVGAWDGSDNPKKIFSID